MEEEQAKGFIIKKLFHHGYIEGKHTDIENLKKGLPSHFRGNIKKAAKELIKEEKDGLGHSWKDAINAWHYWQD